MRVTPIKLVAIPLAILSLALTTGCSSPFGLSDKENPSIIKPRIC